MKESKNLLEVIILAVDSAAHVMICDQEGTITTVNDKFSNAIEVPKELLIGKNYNIFNSEYHSPNFFLNLRKTIFLGNKWKGEICYKKKSGNPIWIETTVVPIFGDGPTPEQYVWIGMDLF